MTLDPSARPLRVTCCVPPFNAGDTTRGVEVSRALVEAGRARGREVEITFVVPRTERNYEAQIRAAGFRTRTLDFTLSEAAIAEIMKADHEGEEFVRDLPTA